MMGGSRSGSKSGPYLWLTCPESGSGRPKNWTRNTAEKAWNFQIFQPTNPIYRSKWNPTRPDLSKNPSYWWDASESSNWSACTAVLSFLENLWQEILHSAPPPPSPSCADSFLKYHCEKGGGEGGLIQGTIGLIFRGKILLLQATI